MTPKRTTEWRNWRGERARLAEGVTDEQYAEARAEIDAEITGYQLSQLRRELGLTQTKLAHTMGVSQARVSEIERGDLAHTELDAVRSYIEALGCQLRMVADLDDRTVDIRGWPKTTSPSQAHKKAENRKAAQRRKAPSQLYRAS